MKRITIITALLLCAVILIGCSGNSVDTTGSALPELKGDLAGVDVTDPKTENNRNMFFLGLVTENGTGEILRNEDGTYTLMYLATTCASSVAPEIFDAEVGYGVMTFTTVK